ncbi:MAG TPA: hypothetical protein VFE47_03115 [Tepidisphaeraceae bacterium]|nr:hypothetical protein [Tepidisphaeraceae bacterium]
MPNRTLTLAATFAVLLTLFAGGCINAPLGDPEKSAASEKLNGWYLAGTPGPLVYVLAYDPRTYLITLYSYEGDGAKAKLQSRTTCKAWMTSVAGMDVLCCKMIDPEWDFYFPGSVHFYFRIRRPDGPDPSAREVTVLNDNFLGQAKTPEELAKMITDNLKNPELWRKEFGPIVLHRATDKERENIEKLIRALSPPLQEPFQFLDYLHDIH